MYRLRMVGGVYEGVVWVEEGRGWVGDGLR